MLYSRNLHLTQTTVLGYSKCHQQALQAHIYSSCPHQFESLGLTRQAASPLTTFLLGRLRKASALSLQGRSEVWGELLDLL